MSENELLYQSRSTIETVDIPDPLTRNETAIRQTGRTSTQEDLVAPRRRDGYQSPHTDLKRDRLTVDRPIRYSDAYDDLMGFRSADDGSATAYAERYGDEAVNNIQFSDTRHNGLYLGQDHSYITTQNRNLVEARQARALAGLPTQAMDEEITYRMLRDPDSWGTSMYFL
jgi:hypothetical protein